MSLPMVEMSNAIRRVLRQGGCEKLSEIPTKALKDYADITEAFALDMRAELARREESENGN